MGLWKFHLGIKCEEILRGTKTKQRHLSTACYDEHVFFELQETLRCVHVISRRYVNDAQGVWDYVVEA